MTELLERAIARVRALPEAMQDDAARMLLVFASGEDEPVYHLTAEEEASLAKSRAQAARGEYASDEQVRALWEKYGA
ncbi:hypothetical protein [Methylobacterium persicinum]|uniref:Uncharacterized protein n=1 Tax=Methylobacterium persicinum TaxID=374426 RepID=A0ABU0HKR9_9HYPH|nr:hypothetical protein [Methylobacterium persicinum]MDQ0442912.1 hypothetical protein [Methylobacterium persicinum]GJE37340.1 hypothetical protein KHHGKMAE_1396 [Methylobacterium persicinum]